MNVGLLLGFIAVVYSHSYHEYEFVKPKLRARFSNERASYSEENPKEIIVEVETVHKHYNLTLFLNEHLITPSFEVLERIVDGSLLKKRGVQKNCFYQGYIGNSMDTTVVASTCQGFHVYIRDENGFEYTIKPANNTRTFSNEHIFYRINRTRNNETDHKCGVHPPLSNNDGNNSKHFSSDFLASLSAAFNDEKNTDLNMNQTKYISVIVILDNEFNKKYGDKSELQALNIMNNVDTIYKHMKTRVALQAIILWKDHDAFNVTNIPGDTLDNLEKYTDEHLFGKLDLDADSVVLLTAISLSEQIVGLAGVGSMCSSRSCALIEAYSDEVVKVADTVAHEIGHTLGFHHTTTSCTCANEPCVMRSYAGSTLAQGFADCTQNKYSEALNKGSLTCLFDYPSKLYGKPKCGNGFLEEGEECDCGSEEECKLSGADKCCEAKTCKLQNSAYCAVGECCENCQAKAQGTLCRKSYDTDCDLPEYCSGFSAQCPTNTFAMDGYPCQINNGSCFNGACKNLLDQCQMLWGPNAIPGNEKCFNLNTRKNDSFANCGPKGNSFLPCAKEDVYCGKLQCTAMKGETLPIYPIIGQEQGGRGSKEVVMSGGVHCNMAYVPFDRDMKDPTVAYDGTKCGEGKVCQQQKCRNQSEISHYGLTCKGGCLNGGICNNRGNCHCPVNYTCPDCIYDPGSLGGSFDSGQGCYKATAKSKLRLMEIITIAGCSFLVLIILTLFVVAIVKRKSLREYQEKQMAAPAKEESDLYYERKNQLKATKGTGPQEQFQLPNVIDVQEKELVAQNRNMGTDNNGISVQAARPDSSRDHLRLDIHPPTYRQCVSQGVRNEAFESIPHLVVGRTDDVVNISVKYKSKDKRPGNQEAGSNKLPNVNL